MNINFSDHEAVTLEIELNQLVELMEILTFILLHFIKHVFILQVSKNRSSLSGFF